MPATPDSSRRRAPVSIRLKLMVALVLACVPMVALLGWFGLATQTNLMLTQATEVMHDGARLQARRLEEASVRGAADARYLALLADVRLLARQGASGRKPDASQQRHVNEALVALDDTTGLYAEVRVLDAQRDEIAGVDRNGGKVSVVPASRLRRATFAPYLQAVQQLPSGAVLVSALRLRRDERGVIRPPQPVIRFIAPIRENGRQIGTVVLTLDVTPLLPHESSPDSQTYLVDADGWYLWHNDPAKAWSGPQDLNTGGNLRQDLGDQAALALQPVEASLRVGDRLLVTYPLAYRGEGRGGYLVLCHEARERTVLAPLQDYRRFFWGMLAVSVLAPLLGGLALSAFFLRPVQQLRRAVHAIAEGDFGATPNVRSGDEFEVLAGDVSVMSERLEQYRQEERLAVVGRMAATIIHDIKNPMSALTSMARVVAEKDLSPEQRRDFAERVRNQSRRILDMLQEILDFSRSGRAEITIQPVPFGELVSELAAELAPQTERWHTTLEMGAVANCVVAADPEKLKRALTNIIVNACEAMEEGGTVRVASECGEGEVTITIADTGPGIPEEVLPHLFEPFVTYHKEHGTGLGLAIAQAIIDAHGGRVAAANDPAGGACFTIWLPSAADACPISQAPGRAD